MSFIETKERGERLFLVHLDYSGAAEYEEFISLAKATNGEVIDHMKVYLKEINAKYLLGKGKIQEIKELVILHNIDMVIFNYELSPTQERNLGKELDTRVIDRSGLILDIFAMRASSHVGRLQVELARLEHISTRLVGGWTHLERQRGGIGLRGGPGEKQIEIDRRLISNRIRSIKNRLLSVHKQRAENRKQLAKNTVPRIALVGYTNAGKSSLFNALTNEETFVQDQLFATLDPSTRTIPLHNGVNPVLIDTVGFIDKLPHKLIESFRATLEESCHADVLLHVVDISSENAHKHIQTVNSILDEIGASDIPKILVYNKIDLLVEHNISLTSSILNDDNSCEDKIWVSVKDNKNLDNLKDMIIKTIEKKMKRFSWLIKHKQGKLKNEIYEYGTINSNTHLDNGTLLKGYLPSQIYNKLKSSYDITEM